MATTKLTLKLLVDKKANRVLFAEAGKDFVDFLFSVLSFPLGSVVRLLTEKKMEGCIENLYHSVESLDETYILNPSTNKELLLNPKPAFAAPLNVPLLTASDESLLKISYYKCGHGQGYQCNYLTTQINKICPGCNRYMSTLQNFVGPKSGAAASSSGQKGYVKEVVTYMIMDDLTVKPMSTISSITLLNQFNIGNVSSLEEKMVDFGMEEGLELLKVSLQSKTALSEVFLGGRKSKRLKV